MQTVTSGPTYVEWGRPHSAQGFRAYLGPASRVIKRSPRRACVLLLQRLLFGFGVLGFGVWHLGFGVWGLGFRVWGLGFGVWCSGFGVWGLGFGVQGLGFRVDGFGFGV